MSQNPLGRIDEVFAVRGEPMRVHKGRSVVRLEIDGTAHYLKRFWFTPGQALRRLVHQGFHELRMIDWLNDNGFLGPVIVDRGRSGPKFFRTRMYFLMREVEGEFPLERFCRRNKERSGPLLDALAARAAGLHDAGFYHTDFSERHILVGQAEDGLTFRQIDLERASLGPRDESQAAADLKTLACSIVDDELRTRVETEFLDRYLQLRRTAPPADSFRKLFQGARPTKTFDR